MGDLGGDVTLTSDKAHLAISEIARWAMPRRPGKYACLRKEVHPDHDSLVHEAEQQLAEFVDSPIGFNSVLILNSSMEAV